ncbi:MAG: hypothetical protein JOS17DRAFT_143948 [Linnemannia elongata]|nr:MAG: hypothetical protein JOS17DRAFT_143948 [Linnemannia elongata]
MQSVRSAGNTKQTRCLHCWRFKHREKNAIQTFIHALHFSIGFCLAIVGSVTLLRKEQRPGQVRKKYEEEDSLLFATPFIVPILFSPDMNIREHVRTMILLQLFLLQRALLCIAWKANAFLYLLFYSFSSVLIMVLRHYSITDRKNEVISKLHDCSHERKRRAGEDTRRKKGRKGKSARLARGRSKNKSEESDEQGGL